MNRFAADTFLSPSGPRTPLGQSPSTSNAESACHTPSSWAADSSLYTAPSNQPSLIQPNKTQEISPGTSISTFQAPPNLHRAPTFPTSAPRQNTPQSPTKKDWDRLKPEIISLYRDHGKSPSAIRAILIRDHAIDASPRQISYRLQKCWNIPLNTKTNKHSSAVPHSLRQTAQGNEAAISLGGKLVPVERTNSLQSSTGGCMTSNSLPGITNDTPSMSVVGIASEQEQQTTQSSCPDPLHPNASWILSEFEGTFDEQLLAATHIPYTSQPPMSEPFTSMYNFPPGMTANGTSDATEAQDHYGLGASSSIDSIEEKNFKAKFPSDELRKAIDAEDNNRFKALVRLVIQEDEQRNYTKKLAMLAQKELTPLVLSIIQCGNAGLFKFLANREMIDLQQSKDIYFMVALVNGQYTMVRDIIKRHRLNLLDLDKIFHQAPHIRKAYDTQGRGAVNFVFDQVFKLHLKSPNNVSAVHIATALLLDEKVYELVARGSKINATMANKQTALHILSVQDFSQHCERATRIAKLLLGHGSIINNVDAAGNTCLHTAASQYYSSWTPAFIEMLVHYGINLNVRNNANQTALELMALNLPPDKTTLKLRRRIALKAAESQ
ncbi:hypothetical protein VHEMI09704 [[Torrubiella] hemipterigena]|uniref:Clr5 domain-containing protein n=1 Tax=[Torrubiella] hemipterigena TaxID=1531966 RepID=A0A0A1TH08_9HYPO|nr:hypothetical protein VHEMI09704 [[Torrubiella] hemipterigena]